MYVYAYNKEELRYLLQMILPINEPTTFYTGKPSESGFGDTVKGNAYCNSVMGVFHWDIGVSFKHGQTRSTIGIQGVDPSTYLY